MVSRGNRYDDTIEPNGIDYHRPDHDDSNSFEPRANAEPDRHEPEGPR